MGREPVPSTTSDRFAQPQFTSTPTRLQKIRLTIDLFVVSGMATERDTRLLGGFDVAVLLPGQAAARDLAFVGMGRGIWRGGGNAEDRVGHAPAHPCSARYAA